MFLWFDQAHGNTLKKFCAIWALWYTHNFSTREAKAGVLKLKLVIDTFLKSQTSMEESEVSL